METHQDARRLVQGHRKLVTRATNRMQIFCIPPDHPVLQKG